MDGSLLDMDAPKEEPLSQGGKKSLRQRLIDEGYDEIDALGCENICKILHESEGPLNPMNIYKELKGLARTPHFAGQLDIFRTINFFNRLKILRKESLIFWQKGVYTLTEYGRRYLNN